jgi:hypothetical protein
MILFIDLIIFIICIIMAVINFNKDWSHFFIFVIVGIHSLFHLGNHFRKKFINKWEG